MEAVQEDGLVNTKVGTCKMQYRYTGKKEKKKKGRNDRRKKTKKEEWSREDAQTQE